MTQPLSVFLAGVGCVGKSTIGRLLADMLDFRFCDLDLEAEKFYNISIRRLRASHDTEYKFLRSLAQVLEHATLQTDRIVVALPPDGLLVPLWKVIKQTRGAVTVLLNDKPENILKRMIFFDIDSRPIKKTLSEDDKLIYLREIEGCIRSLRHSFRRADISVDIAGCSIKESLDLVHRSIISRFIVYDI